MVNWSALITLAVVIVVIVLIVQRWATRR